MTRILERGQIEAFAERAIARVRLPEREQLFAARAARLREHAAPGALGHAIADYLLLMAVLADAQHAALASVAATLPNEEQVARARAHGMPVVQATAWPREDRWRGVLRRLCDALAGDPALSGGATLPGGVREVLDRLRRAEPQALERQAVAILAARAHEVDIAAAPFLMAALQVCWVDLASRLSSDAADPVSVPGVCPICGTLPVASVVPTNRRSQGQRYLHCALCATEWHLVRVTCSHCQSTQGISYRSIDNGPEAIRAECCDACGTYRKILYQEKDQAVEPVADDLASVTLDLLLAEAGFRRGSGNPLLWQSG
jgi:FdhE protein